MVSVLWLMHLHGVASNMLWSWGRDRRGKLINSPDGTQHSNLLTQPQLLNAYARTMLELNSFSELIAAFNSNDAKVKFLYSESSAIQDLNYLDIQQVAYEALYFSGLKTGFITEKMISNNDIIRAELIIIPSVNYVAEKTVRKIQAYYEKGGKLLIVGDNAFQFNGHGENHDEALLEFLKEIPRIKPANSKNLLPILEGYLNDYKINNPVTCSVKDTANSYGIHYRVVQYENKFYLIAINVSNKKLPILIHNNNQEIKAAYNMRKHINEDITALHLFPKEVYFLRF
jgi:beta-galactosidase GanA